MVGVPYPSGSIVGAIAGGKYVVVDVVVVAGHPQVLSSREHSSHGAVNPQDASLQLEHTVALQVTVGLGVGSGVGAIAGGK